MLRIESLLLFIEDWWLPPLGLKQLRFEAAPLYCVEVKNAWTHNLTSPYILMWCLIYNSENLFLMVN
jgi:hypothetical protein